MKTSIRVTVLLGIIALYSVLNSCEKTDDNANPDSKSGWTELGGSNQSSFETTLYNVITDNAGKVYVSGAIIWDVAVWDGSNWEKLGNVSSSPYTNGVYWPIAIDNDENIYAVGRIAVPLANAEYHVAKWEKSSNTWINLTSAGSLFDNGISSIITDASGNVYVAGNVLFIKEAGNYIMKWNGSNWSELGGVLPSGDNIYLHIDALGNLVASFGVNGNFSPYVAKWNGSSWDELGGIDAADFGTGQIKCIGSDNDGNIYAGGYFVKNESIHNITKWSKSLNTWSFPVNMNYSSSWINTIVVDSANNIYVAGEFTDSTNYKYVAKYNGSSWSNFGNLKVNNAINNICFDANGNMYAVGDFTNGSNKRYVAIYKKQ